MTAADRARAHLLISGDVQGVGYRAGCQEEAREIGLTGWVRNLPDGRVEAVAEGPRPDLEKLVAWCQRGPRLAHVTQVALTWPPATGEFRGFRITY